MVSLREIKNPVRVWPFAAGTGCPARAAIAARAESRIPPQPHRSPGIDSRPDAQVRRKAVSNGPCASR